MLTFISSYIYFISHYFSCYFLLCVCRPLTDHEKELLSAKQFKALIHEQKLIDAEIGMKVKTANLYSFSFSLYSIQFTASPSRVHLLTDLGL